MRAGQQEGQRQGLRMWKRGGRTSALDRAQALLSAKRSSRGDGHTVAVGGSAPPNTQTVLSDVSDLSSVSSAPKYEADTVRAIAPEKSQGRQGGSTKTTPTPPPAAVYPSHPHTASPRSLASASHRGSPFRFTGQAQAHFSPSVLSPSPSPPRVSLSPQRRLNSPHRAASPQRSLSSMSGRSEVLSLEELFPAGPHSEDPYSEMSFASSEDFKINVMTLDDLVPATLGFAQETQRKEREVKHSAPDPGTSNRQPPRPSDKVKGEEQQQEEDVLDYQSDFESESRTGQDYSTSQVSEHLQGDGDEVEEVSEALRSDVSCQRTEDDYSSSFSDTTSRTSDGSQTSQSFSRSRDSRSLESGSSQTLCRQPKRRDSNRKVLKEAAVQTQTDTMTHTWTTALSSFNPAVFVLNEMLKQQLDVTKRFIERSRHLHSSLGGDHRLLKQHGFIWMFPGSIRGAQGAIGRHHQATVPAVGQELHLGQDIIYLPTVEVGQADGSDETLPHELLHGSPGLSADFLDSHARPTRLSTVSPCVEAALTARDVTT
ncbi:hypothetical protein INR49_028688, partial [Caranx melampygus]